MILVNGIVCYGVKWYEIKYLLSSRLCILIDLALSHVFPWQKYTDNVSQGDIFISNSFTNITLRTFFQSSCMARNICLGNYSLENWARPIGAALEKETAWHSSCMSNILKLWCNIRTVVHRNGYTEKHHQYHQHTFWKKKTVYFNFTNYINFYALHYIYLCIYEILSKNSKS